MWEMLGLDPESIAESQVYEPGKGRKKDIGDHIGDTIMSAITGTDYGTAVEEAAKTDLLTSLNDTYGTLIDQYGTVDGYSALPDLTSISEQEIKRQLAQRKGTKDARTKAAITYGVDINDLKGLTDPGDIMSAAAGLKKTAEETERTRLEQRADDKETAANLRSDRIRKEGYIEAAKIRNHTISEANNQRAHEAAEKDKLVSVPNTANKTLALHMKQTRTIKHVVIKLS